MLERLKAEAAGEGSREGATVAFFIDQVLADNGPEFFAEMTEAETTAWLWSAVDDVLSRFEELRESAG